MEQRLFTLQETIDLIQEERTLVIAGPEELLSQLPDGSWIAGSNPYLQTPEGSILSDELLYITDFTDLAIDKKFEVYDKSNIHKITSDAFENGIIAAIMPAGSEVINEFALKSPEYENQFINPLLGWVSGTVFEKFGQVAPTCYCGNKRFTDKAVALHLKLPQNKVARLEIVNAYEAQPGSPIITFTEDGFFNKNFQIDGGEHNLYEYMDTNGIEHPQLIADYTGAGINVGMIRNDEEKEIFFTAPVFENTEYRFARKKTGDYKAFFEENMKQVDQVKYSYSCLLNLFNFGLNEVSLGTSGVFTYGEIAFQLLNATFVYLVIDEI